MDKSLLKFTSIDHVLLHRRVVDTRSLGEGTVQAVLVEDGAQVAYVRGDDHKEFTAPPSALRAAR
ncbi:hypothetical protein [Streptomyces sp. NPDC089919]|uniref:hypothetical protein n=1 Tax=Streptomyces sp. NPDC089919 TaxID=3155188 RepID=UPI00342F7F24